MSFEFLIMAFMLLVFCFFTTTFVIKTMISVLNSVRKDDFDEIKPINIITKPEKKAKKSDYEVYLEKQKAIQQERYNTIMDNLEAYDGTDIGQKEVK